MYVSRPPGYYIDLCGLCCSRGITVAHRADNGFFSSHVSKSSLFQQALYPTLHPSLCLESSTADWWWLLAGVSSRRWSVWYCQYCATLPAAYTHWDLLLPDRQFQLCFHLLISTAWGVSVESLFSLVGFVFPVSRLWDKSSESEERKIMIRKIEWTESELWYRSSSSSYLYL